MHERFKTVCQWVERNNGVVKALFYCPEDPADNKSQARYIFTNIVANDVAYERGREYWITIEPAFPHKG